MPVQDQSIQGDPRAAGEAALARGAWEEAQGHFEAALAEADALEGSPAPAGRW